MSEQPNNLQNLVAQVASAYFSNSHVTPTEIPAVISQIAASLSAVSAAGPVVAEPATGQAKATPAQVRKSITPDALISFEDGRRYKTLRRHLSVRGMTPEQYREKWACLRATPWSRRTIALRALKWPRPLAWARCAARRHRKSLRRVGVRRPLPLRHKGVPSSLVNSGGTSAIDPWGTFRTPLTGKSPISTYGDVCCASARGASVPASASCFRGTEVPLQPLEAGHGFPDVVH